MPAVQVRDFPDEMYERLKAEAASNGRSIAQQTKFILMAHLSGQDEAARDGLLGLGTQSAPLESASSQLLSSGHAAAKRANPFQPNANKAELDAQRQARRKAAFEQIDAHPLPPVPSDMDPSSVVREMRDAR